MHIFWASIPETPQHVHEDEELVSDTVVNEDVEQEQLESLRISMHGGAKSTEFRKKTTTEDRSVKLGKIFQKKKSRAVRRKYILHVGVGLRHGEVLVIASGNISG